MSCRCAPSSRSCRRETTPSCCAWSTVRAASSKSNVAGSTLGACPGCVPWRRGPAGLWRGPHPTWRGGGVPHLGDAARACAAFDDGVNLRSAWQRWRGPRTLDEVALEDAIAMFVQNRRGRRLSRRLIRS